MSRSSKLLARGQVVIPGGVNSPVRAFKAVGGDPPFVARGEGSELIDVDGHRYIDLVLSWGPLILGHAGGSVYMHECIVAADVCPNIYVELSSLMPHHILEVLAHVPPARLLAGSDIIASIDAELGKFLTMPITEQARCDILWNTADGLFGPIG